MAIAFVQDDAGTVTDGGTLAFTNNVAANSILIASVAMPGAPSVTSITDTRGNTWALRKRQAGIEGDAAEIWWALNAGAGANTLTFDWSGAASAHVCIEEYSGFANGVSLDQIAGAETTGNNIGHGDITTTVAASLAITGMRTVTDATISSRGDGFSSLTNNARSFHGYKIQTATETVNGDITFNASETGNGAIANFYETVGGAAGQPMTKRYGGARHLRRGGASFGYGGHW